MIEIYRTLLTLLDRSERRKFYLMILLVTVGALVEASSVASVLPLLSVLAKPELIETNAYLAWGYRVSGAGSVGQFQIFLACAVFLYVVFAILMRLATLYAVSRFANMRGFTLSRRLLEGYLHQPYPWFLRRHTSDLGKSILAEVNSLVGGVLMPIIQMIASTFLILFLLALLVLAEPVIALVSVALLGSSYCAIFLGMKSMLHRIGTRRLRANQQRFFIAQEATGGIKDVKLLGLENAYVHRFAGPAREMAGAEATLHILNAAPRLVLEMLSFGGILTVVLYLLFTNAGNLETIIPTLGMLAFAGLRLLPALQQLFGSIGAVQSNRPVVDELIADFREVEANRQDRHVGPAPPRLTLRTSLVLDDIHYSYPEAERSTLNGLSLEIKALTTVGLVGGTGAGKTTAIDLILGLLQPESGEMRVDGVSVTKSNRWAWQRSVGYVPQHIFLTADSIASNIAFGVPRDRIDMNAVERAARLAALHDLVEDLPGGYETEVGERGVRLSGGQRQRVGIARALYADPNVLVLDEATSALDNLTERAVMDAVFNVEGQKTVILIAHRLSTVKTCDRIFLMEKGRVTASGSFEELVQRSTTFARMAEIA